MSPTAQSSKRFEGIIVALLTPFDAQGEVKEDSLRALVRFETDKGVNGLYPCGTAGSGAIMRLDQRKKVAEIVVDESKGRTPVMIHVGEASTEGSAELAKHAEKIGADALGCVTPYYYRPDDASLERHFRKIAETTELPLYLYNLPRYTNVNITPDLALRLSSVPNIVGIKDSSRDFVQILQYLEELPKDFTVICGTDAYIFPALLMGAKGAITAYSNPFPEIYVELYRSFKQKEYEKAARVQFKLNSIREILDKPALAPLYEALRMRGMDMGNARPPLRPMTNTEVSALHRKLVELKALES